MRRKLTKTVKMHYFKLAFRSILLLCAAGFYIYGKFISPDNAPAFSQINSLVLGGIWLFFIIEMILRFFPAKIESMGCQKQFKKNYIPTEAETKKVTVQSGIVTFAVFSAWIALNAIFGILYYTHIIDDGILLLIALAYSVCDCICILFFCPFQTWFMKNKCCTTCRIYNWDYAMMFTPLIFMPSLYNWTLLGAALILLIRWEITLKLHPERFSEKCNKSLHCANCTEKLCQHKRQLRSFIQKGKYNLEGNPTIKNLIKKDK